MTDPLIIMAEALERSSITPRGNQSPGEYVKNDAFQTMASALRSAAAQPTGVDSGRPDLGKCATCGEAVYLEPIDNPLGDGIWWVWVHTRYVYNRTHPAYPL